MAIYHDEIEIEDFEYDEEEETYYYPCPCGDQFQITKACDKFIFFLNIICFFLSKSFNLINNLFSGRIRGW